MKITYIHHSSFLAELEHVYLLFDYFQGDIPVMEEDKPLIVFVSHRHGDHFSPAIFDIEKNHKKTEYIISDDIWQNRVPQELHGKIQFVGPDEELNVDIWPGVEVQVETFKSTDEGVAFWVTTEGKNIYHAGDLNDWAWKGEDEKLNHQMTKRYQNELAKMKGRTCDVAFLPLDSRQEEWFFRGLDAFVKIVPTKHIFPMHVWEDFAVIGRLKAMECSAEYRDRVAEIRGCGDVFEVDL